MSDSRPFPPTGCARAWIGAWPWAATLVLAVAIPAAAHGGKEFDAKDALALSQAAIGRTIADRAFTDERGREVRLAEYRGRPLIVSLVYTSCADVCPLVTHRLIDAVAAARGALGNDSFSVVTIGFDATVDTPERMRLFASQQGVTVPDWRFLATDPPTIAALAQELGFVFYRSPKGFDHLTQTTILDGRGRVYRQIYGATFELPMVIQPLKELVFGTTAPFASLDDLIKKVRLFCTIYDPSADRYRFNYAIFIELVVGGAVSIVVLAFIVRNLWRFRRERRHGHGA